MSLLTNVSTGRIPQPPLVVIYGTPGIGKSTFAAGIEANGQKSVHNLNPLIIDIEDSTKRLDVKRLEAKHIKRYEQITEVIKELLTKEHDHKAIVIDSFDWLEALVWKNVCADHKKKSMADFDYGKGYQESENILFEILKALKYLRDEKNILPIIVCHARVQTFNDPTTKSYDRYTLALHESKSISVIERVLEWAEFILFATDEVYISTEDKGKVNKGNSGDTIVHARGTAAFRAKAREVNFPSQLPLSWDAFVTALKG